MRWILGAIFNGIKCFEDAWQKLVTVTLDMEREKERERERMNCCPVLALQDGRAHACPGV